MLKFVASFVILLALYYYRWSNNSFESAVLDDNITLTYFPLQGRGEPIRLYLKYLGVDFKDNRVSGEEWSQLKTSEEGLKKFTFGQLPHLQNGDYSLVQMNAILAHLDRQAKKRDKISVTEDYLVKQEQYAQGIEDFRIRLTKLAYYGSPEDKQEYLEALPKYLKYFEQILMNNGGFYGKGHYLLGDTLSYIDISLWDVLNKHMTQKLDPNFLDEFPMLQAFYNRIKTEPKISAYLTSAERPAQVFGSRAWLN